MTLRLAAEFVLLAALWGASFLFTRQAALEFGPVATAWLRVAVASAVLLPMVALAGQGAALRRHAGRILALGLLNAGIPFGLFAYAVLSISTGLAAILNATTPLFGALVAWAWLGERPERGRAVGLALGLAGVAMLSWDKADFHSGGTGWAVIACLGATLLYAVAASYTKRYLAGVPALATAAGSLLGAAIGLAWPAWMGWPSGTVGSLSAWGAAAAAGVLCTGLAYVLYFRLIEAAGPARTLTVTFLIPVFALAYGALLLGEPITPWMLVCGAVILVGVALASGIIHSPAGFRRAGSRRPATLP
ncbi:2A78: carboxylate/amino acid/amine transporter [Tepidimonas alkaliphilus]|uniref:2A78: carboxylate/amino acid/amine transporter n=1 Tax=Tepidimonas alkaliphilus TaxID=2588942 RepID=A0A554W655_9BURK|nr:DMT family transporter [Tepidimonas alkaliphilus]TSE19044.1 2A78: carboxylate/amino acid/amine transporter [Tepidimonas alkaliphilus]